MSPVSAGRPGLEPVSEQDFEDLAAMRSAAMRQSLERVGRFDPQRSRARLADGFVPGDTRHVVFDGRRVGFCAIKRQAGLLQLAHLYIHPDAQGRGIGAAVLARIARLADARGFALQVGALRGSRANDFYQRGGFVAVGAGEWDTFYSRAPLVAGRLELLRPDARFADSYRALLAEFHAAGEKLIPFPLSFPHADFDAMLRQLDDAARGVGIPAHFVANSTFWLVRGGTEVAGVSNLRHALTPGLRQEGGHIGYGVRPSARAGGVAVEMLRQSLLRAAGLGIDAALLTCAQANTASARTIVRNGGVLASEEYLAERGEVVQRYWVPVPRDADALVW